MFVVSLAHIDSARKIVASQRYNVPEKMFRHQAIMQKIEYLVDKDLSENNKDFKLGSYSPVTESTSYTKTNGWTIGFTGGADAEGLSAGTSFSFSGSETITCSTISYSVSNINNFGKTWDYTVNKYDRNDNTEARSAFNNLVMCTLIVNHYSKYKGKIIPVEMDYRVDYFIDEFWLENYHVSTHDDYNNLDLKKTIYFII